MINEIAKFIKIPSILYIKCNYRHKNKKVKQKIKDKLKMIYVAYINFIKDNRLEISDKIENEDYILENSTNIL